MTPTLTVRNLDERVALLETTLATVLGVLRANEALWQAFTEVWAADTSPFGTLDGFNEVYYRKLPDLARQTARLPEQVG